MKEIKFISHLSRNIYLYFGVYFALLFIANHQIPSDHFLLGLTAFFIGYAPVYFLNDFIDQHEDTIKHKSNLYTYVNNATIYWTITILTVVIGGAISYAISPIAFLILILLYICNTLYSVKPVRLRDRTYLNLIIIFFIYAIKFYYMTVLLNFPMNELPLSFVIMSGSLGALSTAFYKRHIKRQKLAEYILTFLFTVSWMITIILYDQTFFLFFPLIFILFYFHIKYKNNQIPIGKYQTIYFIYSVTVWFIQIILIPGIT